MDLEAESADHKGGSEDNDTSIVLLGLEKLLRLLVVKTKILVVLRLNTARWVKVNQPIGERRKYNAPF